MEAVVLQFPSNKRYQENLDKLIGLIGEHHDKKIIVAPEVCLTAYDYDHLETAAMFSAKALKTLKKKINEQILVLTLILKEGNEFVNQAVVIHKHKVVHRQDKVKLFKLGDEDLYLRAGKEEISRFCYLKKKLIALFVWWAFFVLEILYFGVLLLK